MYRKKWCSLAEFTKDKVVVENNALSPDEEEKEHEHGALQTKLPTLDLGTGALRDEHGNLIPGTAGLPGGVPISHGGNVNGATVITIDKSKYPESAQHGEDAQKAGYPSTLTIDRSGAAQRRRESLKDTPIVAGMDRDEYPPAMFKEGGTGASVKPITPSDNRGAGACIGIQCRGLPDGSTVTIKTDSKG
ncbi:hypothetical protein GJV07_09305 [Enterobacteriaceae bacterium RIT711]|nr:hypothetical protein [Enterobacteriaceae bacterium RIT711]